MLNGQPQLNDILPKVSEVLDIPDYIYEDATIKYEDVGSWLSTDDSELKKYSPEIYPQGSFRLGTVVRPISGKDEYDIDLVCNLELDKEQTTQTNLKKVVGDRLNKRVDLNRILKESRRCWILNYPAEKGVPNFHMDVLPAICNSEHPPSGILLTDTELKLWQKSNPKAYAEWFYKRMEVIFLEKRAAFAKSINANVEDVPEWQVKTPLQIAVQILKRHRDIYFEQKPDDKPISIIITTLAAMAYRGQADVYDALQSIVKEMPKFIEQRNGKWWVANPVEEENFADKWNEYPERREAFLTWLTNVQTDFAKANQLQTFSELKKSLTPILGQKTIEEAANNLGFQAGTKSTLSTYTQVPTLGDFKHRKLPTWPEQLQYKAKVNGTVHIGFKGKKLWPLTERAVPKDVWLKFILVTDVPYPYEIQWQVVNTGDEALHAGQLRGDFSLEGTPNNPVNWESTSYKGTHWVEAFIIKNGICVARSSRKYVKVR